jgi:hypothetical protein
MGWNHRVIRAEQALSGEFEISYAIHECFYDEKNGCTIPNGWTERPVGVFSETRGGLLAVLAQMADAIRQPVLEEKDGKLIEVEPKREFIDDMTNALKAIEDQFGDAPARPAPDPVGTSAGSGS